MSFLVGILLISMITGCNLNPSTSHSKVAVTIYPFYDAVKSISGGLVDVVVIVPPGSSPHTYAL
ncbi:MAG: hypothetical protein QW076_03720, partial [Candidatus Anstonellales archaeon]